MDMTEKRFILTETSYIYDNQDKGICPTLESVVKVLNELNDENKELKKELDSFNPVVFNDVIKGTVILYSKGDVE